MASIARRQPEWAAMPRNTERIHTRASRETTEDDDPHAGNQTANCRDGISLSFTMRRNVRLAEWSSHAARGDVKPNQTVPTKPHGVSKNPKWC